jgi:hypothetical protein
LFWANFELITGFAAPIVIMVICYSSLLRHIVQSRRTVRTQAKNPVRRVTLMLFIVTLVFVICWTPYHIMHYTSIMHHVHFAHRRLDKAQVLRAAIFNMVAQGMVFFSSCCNPVIYSISSKSFSKYAEYAYEIYRYN